MEQEYRYCSVRPKGCGKAYSYISDFVILPGAYVLVPFGWEDDIVKGEVLKVGFYTKKDAPYPVERTKMVLDMIDRDEYESEGEYDADTGDDGIWSELARATARAEREACPKTDFSRLTLEESAALDEAEYLLDRGNTEKIAAWAHEHKDATDSHAIMLAVDECLTYCAERGDAEAAMSLGSMYYEGRGMIQNYYVASQFYAFAADKGYRLAIRRLGLCWYYGRIGRRSYTEAYRYFSLGALLHNDAHCLLRLGDMYGRGQGVKRNRQYASMLYWRALRACEEGAASSDKERVEDASCLPDAQLRVGQTLLEGRNGEKDVPLALRFLRLALDGYEGRQGDSPRANARIACSRASTNRMLITKTRELIRLAEQLPEAEGAKKEDARGEGA